MKKWEKYGIPKDFFEKSAMKPYSGAMFLYSSIVYEEVGLFSKIEEVVTQNVEEDRNANILTQRQLILKAETPSVLIDLMRKGVDSLNSHCLVQKFLENKDTFVPVLMDWYVRSSIDTLIELATKIFCLSGYEYASKLRERYREIRNSYAKACACLVIGVTGTPETDALFLYHEYQNFFRTYSFGENAESLYYLQISLLALQILFGIITNEDVL